MSNLTPHQRAVLRGRRINGSGSTLDIGNVGSVAYMWGSTILVNSPQFASMQQLLNDTSPTSQVLREHDFELLKMLRSWVQSSNAITAAIKSRVEEMEQLVKDHPELVAELEKPVVAEPQAQNMPAFDGKTTLVSSLLELPITAAGSSDGSE